MSGHLKRFKYYCEEERVWIVEDRKEMPTVCKNNPNHTIKKGSMHQPSSGYCEIIPISGIEALSTECDLREINNDNIIEKINLIARRLKLIEECALLKNLMVERK